MDRGRIRHHTPTSTELMSIIILLTGFMFLVNAQNDTTPYPTTTPVATTMMPPTPGPCDGLICENGGTCDVSGGSAACNCASGWTGTNCSEDVNECLLTGTDYPCDSTNGNCTNNDGSFQCTCNEGYQLESDNTCRDIDACDPNPCNNSATCFNNYPDYNCTCLPGYTDENCSTDINECEWNPCQNGATCNDLVNFYNCTCAPGYVGFNCSEECDADKYGQGCLQDCTCTTNAKCSNTDGTCECDPPFEGATCDRSALSVTLNLTYTSTDSADANSTDVTETTMGADDTITFQENDNFTFMCQVNLAEEDLTEVAFFQNGNQLPDQSNSEYLVTNSSDGIYSLTVLNAGADDTGTYYCNATTIVVGENLTVKSNEISVTVLVPGRIDLQQSVVVSEAKLGETAELNCTVFSSDQASITWERYGMELTNDTDNNRTTVTFQFGREATGGQYFYGILRVSEVIRDDNGTYQCVAYQNGTETDREDFDIVVLEIPELTNPTFTDVQARYVVLNWVVSVNGNSGPESCTVYYNSTENNVTSLVVNPKPPANITGLVPYTKYYFSVACNNTAGTSNRLDYPRQRTRQAEPSQPRNVTLSNITSRTVMVMWVEPEMPNGPIAGYIIETAINTIIPQTFRGTSGTLENLTPGTEYSITVRAFNDENTTRLIGTPSQPTDPFTTVEESPGSPPRDVTTNEDNPDQCIMTWQDPAERNGVITTYTVYMGIFQIGTDNLERMERRVWSERRLELQKSIQPSYSRLEFTVSASTAIGEGPNCTNCAQCTTPVGNPDPPATLPAPTDDNINLTSFTTTIQPSDGRNGPISCYEVIVVQLGRPDVILPNPATDENYARDQISTYDEAKAAGMVSVPYRAMVLAGNELPPNNQVTIGTSNPEGEVTQCDIGNAPPGRRRKRRNSIPPEILVAENGPLTEGAPYSTFVRVYSPTEDNMVYFETGNFMVPVVLKTTRQTSSNVGAVVGGVVAAFVGAGVIAVIVVILYCKGKFGPWKTDERPNTSNIELNAGKSKTPTYDYAIPTPTFLAPSTQSEPRYVNAKVVNMNTRSHVTTTDDETYENQGIVKMNQKMMSATSSSAPEYDYVKTQF